MITNNCPFCGALPFHCEVVMGLDGPCYVRCNRCKARGPAHFDMAGAERIWDRRHQEKPKVDLNSIFGDIGK